MSKDVAEDLHQYCKSCESKDKVPLVTFLKDIGLPPQTIGEQPLSSRQLKKCHKLIKELDEELKTKNKDLFQMKKDAHKMQVITGQEGNLADVDPEDFINQVISLSSNTVAKKLGKEKSALTAYLAEDTKGKISWEKLAFALKQKNPVPQKKIKDKEEKLQD